MDAASDERFDEKRSIRLLGIRSVVCVPMIAGNEIHGVVALDSTGSPGAFEKDDMALLVGIAGQAALALANTRLHRQLVAQELLEQDLALAKKIQVRFLPKNPPEVPGYDFRAFYLSAQEVGGDYYDFFALPEGRIGIALGDVSGKGISAALYMVKLSGEMRYHSVGQSEPAGILSRVNRALCGGEEEGMFATAILLVLDTRTREVKLASAGHPEPLLRRRDGRVEPISVPPNSPVGVDEGSAFEQRAFTLAPGETVVLYTDGVSEAADADRRLFGTQRLIETLGASDGSPEGALNDVLAAVSKFSEGEPQADDLTLLCFGPTVPMSAVKPG
ncbi:MAG TPA: GAF domain-containing SpoIIE family protein phosphatase, partial [Thermoanaerobaculia bacterium]|nr:GAF domain-containing SpoIIE family protein phosphatase [Thermoanaerobaculia bacterium]